MAIVGRMSGFHVARHAVNIRLRLKGEMLTRYTNFRRIGAGGMGVVYRADDTTLRRPVALKFLTEQAFSKEKSRAFFIREARTAAALSHGAICTVYEVAEVRPGEEKALGAIGSLAPGTPFIAMEFVEGRTLEQLLRKKGPLPLDDLLRIAVRIAEGLSVAHARGIVHRDLKPANVMVTPDGAVKILDFGLAKPPIEPETEDEITRHAATASAELTMAGRVVGTVSYMSPEQAMGKKVDTRSDVFAFGVLLYEMAAGKRPFLGNSSTSTLAKILESEPDPLASSRADLPPELLRIVRRCLRKSPNERYNDTRDLVVALKDLRQDTSSGTVARVEATSGTSVAAAALARGRTAWILGGTLLLAAVAVLALIWTQLTGDEAASPSRPPAAHRQLSFSGEARTPVISPDGQWIAYIADEEAGATLYVADLAGGQALAVLQALQLWQVRWSPDGSSLLVGGILEGGEVPGANYIVSRLGGAPKSLGFRGFTFLAWSPDGARFAGTASAQRNIWLIDAATGETETLPVDDSIVWNQSLDWSAHDLLVLQTIDATETSQLWVLPVDGRPASVILESRDSLSSPRWSGDGDALYYMAQRGQTREIRKLPVDPLSGTPAGEPQVLLTGLQAGPYFSVSSDGARLAYSRVNTQSRLWSASLQPSQRCADMRQLTRGTVVDTFPAFSPEGGRLAFTRSIGESRNVFLMDLDEGTTRQLTFMEASNAYPAWSPDGTQIVFGSSQGDKPRVWRVPAGGGTPTVLDRTDLSLSSQVAWSPRGQILYQTPGNRNFRMLDLDTGSETLLLEKEAGWIFLPKFSPDGSLVAVFRNYTVELDSGRQFRGLWVVPTGGGEPRQVLDRRAYPTGWSPDGAWVYARESAQGSPGKLLRVAADGSRVEHLCELPDTTGDAVSDATSSPDGRTAVLAIGENPSDVWLAEPFDPSD